MELKEDSTEKLAAVAGKPTKHYLFAEELNALANKLSEWSPKTYTERSAVFYKNNLYILNNDGLSYPFSSVNIDDEIAVNIWIKASQSFIRVESLPEALSAFADMFYVLPDNSVNFINGTEWLSVGGGSGGGSNAIHTISFSFRQSNLGGASTSWRTNGYGNAQTLYNIVPENINFDGVNNILNVPNTRAAFHLLPYNCKLVDIQNYMVGAQFYGDLDFRVIYYERNGLWSMQNYQYLGKVLMNNLGAGSTTSGIVSDLNTNTVLNKGGYVLMLWNNNNVNVQFFMGLIQPIFEKV